MLAFDVMVRRRRRAPPRNPGAGQCEDFRPAGHRRVSKRFRGPQSSAGGRSLVVVAVVMLGHLCHSESVDAQRFAGHAVRLLAGAPGGVGLEYRLDASRVLGFVRWEGTALFTTSQFVGVGGALRSNPSEDITAEVALMVGGSRCRRTALVETGCGRRQRWLATYGAAAGIVNRLSDAWFLGLEIGRRSPFGSPKEGTFVREWLTYVTLTHFNR